ncbi:hypothetical protein PUN4_430009 [Paraburkholderia unamae]|nr:hypothetical protein PUN4_430009 [Paraburkholderia unamae]
MLSRGFALGQMLAMPGPDAGDVVGGQTSGCRGAQARGHGAGAGGRLRSFESALRGRARAGRG